MKEACYRTLKNYKYRLVEDYDISIPIQGETVSAVEYTLTPNGARFDRTATMTPIRRESQGSTDCLARPDPFIDRVDSMNRVREAIASGESMVGFSAVGKSK